MDINDPEYIAALVDRALQRTNRHDQVKIIIEDKALTPDLRREALDVLKMRRDMKQNGLG